MPIQVLIGPTIEQGESLSAPLDCSAGPIVRITTPPNWDPGVITFQVSSDGEFYNDLFNMDGHEVSIVAMPAVGILIEERLSISAAFVKFRSGTRDKPVPQHERVEFAVAIHTELP